jgi:nucleoside 2-deoxyribosyltransferase
LKFYIASSRRNKEIVRYVARKLEQEGFTHIYDWTQNTAVDSYDELKQIGEEEIEAVKAADFLVLLMPAGVGSHVELGVALGLGKRVYLYTADHDLFEINKTSTFYFVKGVHKFVGFIENFIGEIKKYEGKLLH